MPSNLRTDIGDLEKELEKIGDREQGLRELLRKAQFARKCLEVSRALYDELTTEVRLTVAAAFQDNFKRMIWNGDYFASVSIDAQYRVSVINSLGFEILPDLAAGQRECLALSFSLALSDVSGYELPMVIDTPMGRLNPDVQVFVSQVLAEATQPTDGIRHQLLMLMTETEYNPEVAKVLAARQPRVFRIAFDEQRAVASLSEEK